MVPNCSYNWPEVSGVGMNHTYLPLMKSFIVRLNIESKIAFLLSNMTQAQIYILNSLFCSPRSLIHEGGLAIRQQVCISSPALFNTLPDYYLLKWHRVSMPSIAHTTCGPER